MVGIIGKKVKWCRNWTDRLAHLEQGTVIDKLLMADSSGDFNVNGYLIIDDEDNLHVVNAQKLRSIPNL